MRGAYVEELLLVRESLVGGGTCGRAFFVGGPFLWEGPLAAISFSKTRRESRLLQKTTTKNLAASRASYKNVPLNHPQIPKENPGKRSIPAADLIK